MYTKPSITLTDIVFFVLGVAYTLVVGTICVALLIGLLGCGVGPNQEGYSPEPAEVGKMAPAELAINTLDIKGKLAYIEEYGILNETTSCLTYSDLMYARLRGLATDEPYLVGWYGDIPCDSVHTYANLWRVGCAEQMYGPVNFPAYYDFYVERIGWDTKQEVGWAYLTYDLAPWFWCTYTWRITDVTPTYAWR